MTDAQTTTFSRADWLGIIVGGAIILIGWPYLAFQYLFPALWGPYTFTFMAAGPLVLSRGGMMIVLFAPVWAILVPALRAKTILQWLAFQLCTAWIAVMVTVCFGFYVHNVINLQGLDASLEFLASEAGFDNAAAVPADVKAAFALSDKLARKGEAPWLPGVWKSVDWPTIPAKRVR